MKCVTPARVFVAWLAAFSFLVGGSATAQATAPVAGGHQRVLIFPFTQVNPPGKLDWLSHGIQEDIMTELNSSRGMQAMTPAAGQNNAAADLHAALDQGRQEGANYVVFGTYQASDSELRISGQVVDVNDPEHASTKLKVTGPLSALFHLEDALDSQVESAVGLGPPPQSQAQAQTSPQAQTPPEQNPQSFAPPQQNPSETYIGPYNSPDYGYTDQGYYGDDSYAYTPYTADPYYYGGYYPYYGFGFYGGPFFRGGYGHGFHSGFYGNSHTGNFHGGGSFHGSMGGGMHGGMGGGMHGGGGGGGHR